MAQLQIQRLTAFHEGIIDRLLADPSLPYGTLANQMGISKSWMSIIVNSDCFKQRLAERRAELTGQISEGIKQNLLQVSEKALSKLHEALDKDDVDPRLVLDAADRMLTKAGFAPTASKVVKTTTLVAASQVVDKGTLEEARVLMARTQEVIDASAEPAPS